MLPALILAARPTIVAMKLCRVLSGIAAIVWTFWRDRVARVASNFCHRRLVSPPLSNKVSGQTVVEDDYFMSAESTT